MEFSAPQPQAPGNSATPRLDSQVNWLELARFAAVGEGHADLGRGVRRLATLAAAQHRTQLAQRMADGPLGPEAAEKDFDGAHGRALQDRKAGTDAGTFSLDLPEVDLPGAGEAGR